ncbi:MAG: ABC transporter permease [Spirochaetales bacterium]|nr:ABC transporter permease [Spirochaetales bacterium]MCF7939245.1 ABC transporter permease [Spirochaetales bacterium]
MNTTKLKNTVIEQKILLVILALGVYLSFRSGYFLTFQNITNIFLAVSFEGMVAIGMALLIIVGEIDLSVGSIMAFGATMAILFQPYGIVVGIAAGLMGGAAVGLMNGVLVTKLRLPSIAVTLGTMVLFKGVVFAFTKEHTLTGTNESFTAISQTELFNIPVPVYLFIGLAVLFGIILQRSSFGRNIFAVGGNATASGFFGIKVDRVKILCFVLLGLLSGLAGVMLAGKLNIASGNIGQYSNVLVITAVLLGGISLEGGEGRIIMAIEGILLLGVMNNAMVIMKISPFVQEIIRGLLLILIIIIDAINIERKKYL